VPNRARHKHLVRQLRKLDLSAGNPPPREAWIAFLDGVNKTYEEIDKERYTLERSVSLFEREMHDLHRRLEEDHDRIRVILEAAPVGIMRTELDGRVTMVNPAFERILGYSGAEMLTLSHADLILAADRPAAEAQVASLRAKTVRGYSAHRKYLHKNGNLVHAVVAASLVVDAAHNALFTIEVIEDISERIRLEVELHHAQKLESVGRLASGIAHEINTPIQFVGDYVSFLQQAFTDLMRLCDAYREAWAGLGGALPPDVCVALQQAEETADLDYLRERAQPAFAATLGGIHRVATIVKAMKSFGHPDQGEKSCADINAALESTLTVAANELKYVADVETDLGDIPDVSCYLSDLNQVFLNLLVNGAHASGDAAVGNPGRGKIRVKTFREDDFVVVSISDTGGGIPEAIRHRIFEPFFTTKEVGRGTGQGLAIARAVVVEKHGGKLTFETEVGKGTTFLIRLPLEPAEPPLLPLAQESKMSPAPSPATAPATNPGDGA
jgi:PAS domain S-box-containing protein